MPGEELSGVKLRAVAPPGPSVPCTHLLSPSKQDGVNPAGREEAADSRRKMLATGGSGVGQNEGGWCVSGGWDNASQHCVRFRWNHVSEQQVIQPTCAPFLKCHRFPEGISSTLMWCHLLQPVR